MTRRHSLIGYDFRERKLMPCYKCGHAFREGRYREHIINSRHPRHAEDKSTKPKRRSK